MQIPPPIWYEWLTDEEDEEIECYKIRKDAPKEIKDAYYNAREEAIKRKRNGY